MRLLWMDILKILAIFGVILLHVSAPFVVPFEKSREWWIGNIYDSSTRWCVPLFVMASGALLLRKAEQIQLRKWLWSRVGRILVPFLSWSIIYFFYRIHFKGENALGVADFFPMLLSEPIYYHLWFVYMLIVLYLFAPGISVLVNKAAPAHVWYLVGLWFFWASVLPIINKPLNFETYFTSGMDDYSALHLSGYFLLGHMLKDRYARTGMHLFLVAALFFAALALTIIGTYLLSESRGEFRPFFYRYDSVSVVVMTVSLFLLVKSLFHTRDTPGESGIERVEMRSPKLLHRIGMSVFGIYLVHALMLESLSYGYFGFIIDHTSFLGKDIAPEGGLPLFAVSIFVFSLLSIFVIRYIPIIRDIFT